MFIFAAKLEKAVSFPEGWFYTMEYIVLYEQLPVLRTLIFTEFIPKAG